jgi:hypothetical protein
MDFAVIFIGRALELIDQVVHATLDDFRRRETCPLFMVFIR